jgi:methylthioribose-1-phosphate isomerase
MALKTLEWKNDKLFLLDQTRLPQREVYHPCGRYQDVAAAIKKMVVRGAPAIGVAAAFGMVLGARQVKTGNPTAFHREMLKVARNLIATRPTAVNILWAVERMKRVIVENLKSGVRAVKKELQQEAAQILREDVEANRQMGRQGQILVPDGSSILTHCNAGVLATAGYGTALGVIRAAVEAGKRVHVFVDETRPFLQGARLTAWELMKDRIPYTLIADNMAGALMAQGKIHLAVVGADRIAANGDVANKIGTYSVARLCQVHRIPFYVAAPLSTVDLAIGKGEEIPIEQRPEKEMTHFRGQRIVPRGARVLNPAFDVTPHRYIQAIITEKGIVQKPFKAGLKKLLKLAERMEPHPIASA